MARSGNDARIAIIGGGIAGLAAGYYLSQAGARVDLFEAEEETGGLARGFEAQGLKVERYYHFICLPDSHLLELARGLGLADRLRWRRTRTTYFYEGRLYPFTSPLDLLRFSPIPFTARVNMGLETLKWSKMRNWTHLDNVPAREWLISKLGRATYEVVWEPLLTMKFGEYHDRVSAAWIWHRVHRVAKSRKTALHPQVMGHFQGGTETLLSRLREKIGERSGRIFLSTPVQAILRGADGRVRGVRAQGTDRDYDAVITTVPLAQAAELLPVELADFRARLARVDYLGVACLVVWMDTSVSNSFWCNIHDSRIPFNGIIETSKLNPEAGRGRHLIYVPNYLPVSHPRFSYSDEQLFEEFSRALPILRPGLSADAIRSFQVFRSRYAQAVCKTGFLKIIPPHTTPLPGLFLTDSTQLYPEDRTLSGTVALAREAAGLALDYARGERGPA